MQEGRRPRKRPIQIAQMILTKEEESNSREEGFHWSRSKWISQTEQKQTDNNKATLN